MSCTALIGGDWGGSNLRLFRFGAGGEVLDRREAPLGALALAPGAFEGVLAGQIGDWSPGGPAEAAPIVLCGMVGARQGWREAAYVSCPAGLDDIAAGATAPVAEAPVWIVPGVLAGDALAPRDVIRGEETQVMGARPPPGCGLILAPGTHSKWIAVEGGRIVDHFTYITGELFSLLRRHSSLCRLAQGDEDDPEAFGAGATRGLEVDDVLGALFSVRVDSLFSRLAPEGVCAHLSGLLIGAEARAGLARFGTRPRIHIVASPTLGAHYRRALTLAGVRDVSVEDGEMASARGLWRIGARLCGLEA